MLASCVISAVHKNPYRPSPGSHSSPQHPHNIDSQLTLCPPPQVYSIVGNKSWETRVAAGEALSALADIFVHPTVQDVAKQCCLCGADSAQLQASQVRLGLTGQIGARHCAGPAVWHMFLCISLLH